MTITKTDMLEARLKLAELDIQYHKQVIKELQHHYERKIRAAKEGWSELHMHEIDTCIKYYLSQV